MPEISPDFVILTDQELLDLGALTFEQFRNQAPFQQHQLIRQLVFNVQLARVPDKAAFRAEAKTRAAELRAKAKEGRVKLKPQPVGQVERVRVINSNKSCNGCQTKIWHGHFCPNCDKKIPANLRGAINKLRGPGRPSGELMAAVQSAVAWLKDHA